VIIGCIFVCVIAVKLLFFDCCVGISSKVLIGCIVVWVLTVKCLLVVFFFVYVIAVK
jgi:hypothetical protein